MSANPRQRACRPFRNNHGSVRRLAPVPRATSSLPTAQPRPRRAACRSPKARCDHTHAHIARTRTLTAPCLLAVPDRISFPEKEEEILAWWEENGVFQESLKQSLGKPVWSFYDGPPFATGLPHYGHLLAGTIKASPEPRPPATATVGRWCEADARARRAAGHRLPVRAPDRPLRRAPLRLGLPRPPCRVRDR